LASIDLIGKVLIEGENAQETIKLCFELKSLYIKGVLVGNNFYELRKSGDPSWLVDESIALECGDNYYEMFEHRHNPDVELSDAQVVTVFNTFIKLDPESPRALFQASARCIGLILLMFMEPSRRWDMTEKMCSGDQGTTYYLMMDLPCWNIVHTWDNRSVQNRGGPNTH